MVSDTQLIDFVHQYKGDRSGWETRQAFTQALCLYFYGKEFSIPKVLNRMEWLGLIRQKKYDTIRILGYGNKRNHR